MIFIFNISHNLTNNLSQIFYKKIDTDVFYNLQKKFGKKSYFQYKSPKKFKKSKKFKRLQGLIQNFETFVIFTKLHI